MDRFDVVNFILLYIKKEEASESWEMHQAGEDHHCSIKVQVARRKWMPNMLQHSTSQIPSSPITKEES